MVQALRAGRVAQVASVGAIFEVRVVLRVAGSKAHAGVCRDVVLGLEVERNISGAIALGAVLLRVGGAAQAGGVALEADSR